MWIRGVNPLSNNKLRIHEDPNPELRFFANATRTMVLTQLLCCAVHRVFSRLKLIKDSCGDNMMESILELCVFTRCNGDVHIFK